MHSYSILSTLFALTLTALVAWPAAPAAGESGELAALAPRPARTQIQIQPAALEPERVEAAADRGFELANASTALARVEFQLPRGEGLTCVTDGEAPVDVAAEVRELRRLRARRRAAEAEMMRLLAELGYAP